MQRRLVAVLLAAAAAGLARESAAQPGAPLPAPRFGILAGLNSATLGGDDVGDDDNDRRTGLVAGVYLKLPLGTVLSVQPELLYSMKGAAAGSGDDAAALNTDYFELPVLLRADLPTGTAVRPYLFVGPTFSLRTRCELEADGGGFQASVDCDDLAAEQPQEDTPEFKKFDLGVALGGGVTVGMGTASALNFGVRYTHGTSSIIDPGDVKNRVLSFTVGLEIPFGRR